jgi:hypothetical protein
VIPKQSMAERLGRSNIREYPAASRSQSAGFMIINADDWGRDSHTTDQILTCIQHATVSAVSAMVFMSDSVRAARIALERGIEVGLHLNLTTPFSQDSYSGHLLAAQGQIASYLRASRLAQTVFHPRLHTAFSDVVARQLEEFARLYGRRPDRIDGHHHMHLCANVVLARLLPRGTLVRRNFSFQPGEKSYWNRLYRRVLDRLLATRHDLVDYFFSLAPLNSPGRLQRIASLSRTAIVEVETHPTQADEYLLLTANTLPNELGQTEIRPPSAMFRRRQGRSSS